MLVIIFEPDFHSAVPEYSTLFFRLKYSIRAFVNSAVSVSAFIVDKLMFPPFYDPNTDAQRVSSSASSIWMSFLNVTFSGNCM